VTTVVELCGLPGTGKTTLAAQVAVELTERGLRCEIADVAMSAAVSRSRRLKRKAIGVAIQIGRHPVRSADAARWVAASRQESPRDAVAGLAQWLTVQQTIRTARREDGVQLLEEGIVQTLWTVGLRARRDVVRRLLDGTPEAARPDLLVVVEAPVDVVGDRLAGRASRHSRTQGLDAAAQAAELQRGQDLLEKLTTWASIETQVVNNDGRTTVSALATVVADRVDRITGPPRRL
jgi:predicted kinase